MKHKKYLIILVVSLLFLSSFLVINRSNITKRKVLKELNYDVTYKQAFPDKNLRNGILLCIMRNKCDNYDENIYNYKKYYEMFYKFGQNSTYINQHYDNIAWQTTMSPTIYDYELDVKAEEKIKKEDLEKIKVLIPYHSLDEISSLKGVEYLPNLKAVFLNKVKDENIDFSYNKQLERVVLSPSIRGLSYEESKVNNIKYADNNVVKEIGITYKDKETLDLRNLVNLKNVYVNESKVKNVYLPSLIEILELISNKIENIDLSNLIHLNYLQLYGNLLKTIDVSHLTKLKFINLNDNPINQSLLDFRNNLDLEEAHIGRQGYMNIDKMDFSKNIKLKKLGIMSNLKELDLTKNVNLEDLYLSDNNIPKLDLSKNINLKNINILENRIANFKIPDNLTTGGIIQTVKFKLKKNSYADIPLFFNDNQVFLENSTNFKRVGNKYVFDTLGTFHEVSNNLLHGYLYYVHAPIEVVAGEEDSFNPIINQGDYKPEIDEDISKENIKKMITNLPSNIKNFEIVSPLPTKFNNKGKQNVKVRVTFSDDTFKEFDVPVNIYEKRYISPTVNLSPNPAEVLEGKAVNINITRTYDQEERIDDVNFIKYIKDTDIDTFGCTGLPSGLTCDLSKISGTLNYIFTGTEEVKEFDFIYKEGWNKSGKITKQVKIKLLRDTDGDGIPDKDDDDKDGDGYSNAVEIAKGSDPYNKNSTPDMTKKKQLDELVKELEKLINDTKKNQFDNKNKNDVDNLKNNILPDKENKKNDIKNSYNDMTSDTDLEKLKQKVQKEIDDLKQEINKLRDKANFEELDKEIAKPIEDIYTPETVKPLKDKIEEAKNMSRDTSTQSEVDDMTRIIKDLRDKLKINKEKLKEKIEELEKKIDEGKCLNEECKKTLEDAKDLYNKSSITKEEMLNMIARINNLLNKNETIVNPKTGVATYLFILILIIIISVVLFKRKKNYIR